MFLTDFIRVWVFFIFFMGSKLNTCILYEPNVHFFDHSFVHVTVNVSITQWKPRLHSLPFVFSYARHLFSTFNFV